MRIHLISIGGAVMHNLALELNRNGHNVTGSDDEVFEPSKSRLTKAGLLPDKMGWDANRITVDIDRIILGMHARVDNEELLWAQALGLVIQSFPEFVAEQSQDKKRIVVAGSHGKTSTTAMIMHVLNAQGLDFDYLVGSQLEGFELMVKLSDAPLIILEGDEYLSSPIDRRPKFMWYNPHVAIITGVAWDHINVFPTWEGYCDQFKLFTETILDTGSLIYYQEDEVLQEIAASTTLKHLIPYKVLDHDLYGTQVTVKEPNKTYPMIVFGKHNLENMQSAVIACEQIGISRDDSLSALQHFTGTAKRLEKVYDANDVVIFRDFAHSPSKVKATVDAVKSTYSAFNVVAVLELHTFSSLNEDFLPLYAGSMDAADDAFVHYNTHVFEMKKMAVLEEDKVQAQFGQVTVETDIDALWNRLKVLSKPKTVFLMMSSGNFGGKDVGELGG
ncbi:MAG: UDP-N-acetylmuramate: L-alanyl-gamma-D-glutamyl-meso-diaminopimelate ligase [Bacteroidia bacterium]|jgi:UDP-N-acetylmuramate: L-alanyl-gamma-D-glutamyl-meso-diaminopimelate ligase